MEPSSTQAAGGSRRVTMADVARRAGVSTTLVSIVLRDAPGASQETRARIREIAAQMGYRPDVRARSLASAKSNLIGVVFGTAQRFHFEMIDGLYAAAEERGWELVLTALTPSRDEQRALESLQAFRFEAVVMLGPPVAEPLFAGQVPLVVMGWQVANPHVDVVRTSDTVGLDLAVAHLIGLGHRRIAHLQGGAGLVAISRREAYESAMRRHGLARLIDVVECEGEDQLDGQRAALSLVRRGRPLPTAITAFNDDLAAASLSVLAQQGLRVPEDVSVIGFDDSTLARSPTFNLTSIRQQPLEMGRLALERLVARSAGEAFADREIVLEPELVVRTSTAPAPVDTGTS